MFCFANLRSEELICGWISTSDAAVCLESLLIPSVNNVRNLSASSRSDVMFPSAIHINSITPSRHVVYTRGSIRGLAHWLLQESYSRALSRTILNSQKRCLPGDGKVSSCFGVKLLIMMGNIFGPLLSVSELSYNLKPSYCQSNKDTSECEKCRYGLW